MILRGVLALLLAITCAAEARAFVTRVSPTLDLSDAADSSILCPTGSPLGGGFDTENLGVVRARGSGVAEPDPPTDPIERWGAQLVNPTGMFQPYRLAAVCGQLPGLVYVFDDGSSPAGGQSSNSVLCPLGKVAVGGGSLTIGFPVDARLTASGPYFPAIPIAPGLADRPDGEAPLPGGWRVAYQNVGAATTELAFAVCADFDDVHPIVESDTVGAGAAESAIALCPSGTSAVGGGFDAANRDGLRLTASSPLFIGNPLLSGIFDVAGSTTAGAVGWRIVLRNESASAKSFKVAAMCVPEPEASAAISLCALAIRAARRARR